MGAAENSEFIQVTCFEHAWRRFLFDPNRTEGASSCVALGERLWKKDDGLNASRAIHHPSR
jgi:hypothetical protein